MRCRLRLVCLVLCGFSYVIAHRPASSVTELTPTCQIAQLSAAELEREYATHKKKEVVAATLACVYANIECGPFIHSSILRLL